MLTEALEHLVRGIVLNPDEVRVKDKDLRRGRGKKGSEIDTIYEPDED